MKVCLNILSVYNLVENRKKKFSTTFIEVYSMFLFFFLSFFAAFLKFRPDILLGHNLDR